MGGSSVTAMEMPALDITCIVSGAETDGTIAVFEEIVASGQGPPLHTHRSQTEIFHIIEGNFVFCVNGEFIELAAGGSAVVPEGAVHAFRNVGEKSGRIHFELLPAGRAEESFERLVDRGNPIDDLPAFFDEYEMDLVGPPLS